MPTPFSVMSWNVENLFPVGFRSSPTKTVQQVDFDAKLAYLARTILQVLPDVLALQEVGGRNATDNSTLLDLQRKLDGKYPHALASSHPDGRGIRNAFLSRLNILEQEEITTFADGALSAVPDWDPGSRITHLGRAALVISVEPTPGTRVQLVNVHLKSKLVSYPGTGGRTRFSPTNEDERTTGEALALLRRTAEAAAVRFHLNRVMQPDNGTHSIVLGDLNDEPRAATSQLLVGPQDADATRDDGLDPFRLYNLVDSIPMQGGEENDKIFLPPEERYTRVYKGRRELIDHILVSKGLLGSGTELGRDEWKVQEVRILVSSIDAQGVGDDPLDRVGASRPDHAPVYSRFEL